jgi:hypothetical protein
MAKGVNFHGCKQCKTRVCGDCFRSGAAIGAPEPEKSKTNSFFATGIADCPEKHGLKIYSVPSDALTCDRCKTVLKKGSNFHGCKACKTRLCGDCFKLGDAVAL